MSFSEEVVISTSQYRAWIDNQNSGHIRVLKRINFITILSVIRKIAETQQKKSDKPRVIFIYIPESLKVICSDNLLSFIGFIESCSDITITLVKT